MKMSKGIVLIDTESGTEKDVVGKIQNLEGVKEVHIVYGHNDLIAKVEAENIKELREMVCHIREMDAIHATSTLLVT